MRELLEHVPTLVKTYGKWPSFVVLLFAIAQGSVALALIALLFQLLR
jgi:hypothetical protein